jgi:hypothetical protein
MKNLPQHIENQFFRVLNKEIGIKAFEKWVYETEELEAVLSAENYLDLIAFNYNQEDLYGLLTESLYDLFIKFIDSPKYENYRIKRLLTLVTDKDDSWKSAVSKLHSECINSYNFLDSFFNFYFLIRDNRRNPKVIEEMYPLIKNEAEKVLDWLNSEKIVIKGREGHRKGTNYIDSRTKEEKELIVFDEEQSKKWGNFAKNGTPQYFTKIFG